MQRELLLISHCLLWARIESRSWDWDWSWSGHGSGISQNSVGTIDWYVPEARMELRYHRWKMSPAAESSPVSPQKLDRRKSRFHAVPPLPPSMVKKHSSNDDKFVNNGQVELVDLEVVVGSALLRTRGGLRCWVPKAVSLCMLVRNTCRMFFFKKKIEIVSATEEERDDWISGIRGSRTRLFVALYVTNPNSTLSSSASTNDICQSVQAVPFLPSDDRLGT